MVDDRGMPSAVRCFNLGPVEQDRRLRMGVIWFAISLACAVLLAKKHVGSGLELIVVLPFFLSAYGLFQALYKT